jgi:FkbM family methyltransferase
LCTEYLRRSRRQSASISAQIQAPTAPYSQNIHTSAEIYAVEPSAKTYAVLEKQALPRVRPVNCAVSNANGSAALFSWGVHSETASLSPEIGGKHVEEVRVATLDTLVQELGLTRLDLIKVDTEGFECEVFEGMQGTLATLKPTFIQFEFNVLHLTRGHTLLSLARLLPGYTLYRLIPHGWIRIDPAKYLNNVFMFSNIVAVRES